MTPCKSCNGTGECAACADADSYACNACFCTGECPDCDGPGAPGDDRAMTDQAIPVEARCDHCKQTRPLFLYVPDHNAHAIPVPCEWCDRDKQPLLCTRCWGAERLREENAPMSAGEQTATEFLFAAVARNGRLIRQAESDRAMCDGIAAATALAETE